MQTKFVGGTEENHENEDRGILHTLRRELTEETDMILPMHITPVLLCSVELPGHMKNFYEIEFLDLEGSLRIVEKTIEGDWMSVPDWLPFNEAKYRLYKTHQPALMKSHERYLDQIEVGPI